MFLAVAAIAPEEPPKIINRNNHLKKTHWKRKTFAVCCFRTKIRVFFLVRLCISAIHCNKTKYNKRCPQVGSEPLTATNQHMKICMNEYSEASTYSYKFLCAGLSLATCRHINLL